MRNLLQLFNKKIFSILMKKFLEQAAHFNINNIPNKDLSILHLRFYKKI